MTNTMNPESVPHSLGIIYAEESGRGITHPFFVLILDAFKEEAAKLQADDSLQPWEKVSAAAGIAKYEKGRDASTEEVLRRADEAMYRDKIAMKAVRTDR